MARVCVATVADVRDVEAGVPMRGGEVAGGRQSGHVEAPMQRRVAVDFDARRCFANDEEFVVDRRDTPDRSTVGQRVQHSHAGLIPLAAAHLRQLCTTIMTVNHGGQREEYSKLGVGTQIIAQNSPKHAISSQNSIFPGEA